MMDGKSRLKHVERLTEIKINCDRSHLVGCTLRVFYIFALDVYSAWCRLRHSSGRSRFIVLEVGIPRGIPCQLPCKGTR